RHRVEPGEVPHHRVVGVPRVGGVRGAAVAEVDRPVGLRIRRVDDPGDGGIEAGGAGRTAAAGAATAAAATGGQGERGYRADRGQPHESASWHEINASTVCLSTGTRPVLTERLFRGALTGGPQPEKVKPMTARKNGSQDRSGSRGGETRQRVGTRKVLGTLPALLPNCYVRYAM